MLLANYAEVGAEPIVTGSEGSARDVVLEVVAPEEEEGDQPTGFWTADVRLGGIVASESPDAVELGIFNAATKELALEVGDLLDQGDFVGHDIFLHLLRAETPGMRSMRIHSNPISLSRKSSKAMTLGTGTWVLRRIQRSVLASPRVLCPGSTGSDTRSNDLPRGLSTR